MHISNLSVNSANKHAPRLGRKSKRPLHIQREINRRRERLAKLSRRINRAKA